MPPFVVALLVVTLLLPGLAMLFAIVLRYLLHGESPGPDPQEAPDAGDGTGDAG